MLTLSEWRAKTAREDAERDRARWQEAVASMASDVSNLTDATRAIPKQGADVLEQIDEAKGHARLLLHSLDVLERLADG